MNIKSTPLFNNIKKSDIDTIQKFFKEREFDKGEVLFHGGQACKKVYIVRSGRVKVYRISASGREQILETLNPGDTCACHPGNQDWSCSATSEAVVPTTVWFVSIEEFSKLIKGYPRIAENLGSIFAKKLKCFSSLIEEVSLKDSKQRLVKFLLDMTEDLVDSMNSKDISLPFTREEIAQRLGTARETVARNLSYLKKKKLIDIKPKAISILDKSGLQSLL